MDRSSKRGGLEAGKAYCPVSGRRTTRAAFRGRSTRPPGRIDGYLTSGTEGTTRAAAGTRLTPGEGHVPPGINQPTRAALQAQATSHIRQKRSQGGLRQRPQRPLGSEARARAAQRARFHGLTAIEVEQILAAQGGRCAICRRPMVASEAIVDHDHQLAEAHGHPVERGCRLCVRGLLCPADNTLLGLVQDDVERLKRAAAYAWRLR